MGYGGYGAGDGAQHGQTRDRDWDKGRQGPGSGHRSSDDPPRAGATPATNLQQTTLDKAIRQQNSNTDKAARTENETPERRNDREAWGNSQETEGPPPLSSESTPQPST